MNPEMAQAFIQRMQANQQGEQEPQEQQYEQPRNYDEATQEEQVPDEYYRKLGPYANPVRRLVEQGMPFQQAVKTVQQKVVQEQQTEQQTQPSFNSYGHV